MNIGIVKVEQGKALIRSNVFTGVVQVSFTGGFVLPVMHKAEIMDISVKTIELDRSGSDGLICRDNIRADIKITFFVRVNKTENDVIKVAQMIGCTRASDQRTVEELFIAKFSEALKTAGKQLDFVDLYTQREEFRDRILAVIGTDLNGYSLEDCALDYLEQTPLSALDQFNILDAQGIRKITELTAIEHVKTNEYENTEKKQIKKQDVERIEAILELDRQQADAENKQQREIASVQAREQAETLKIQAEERLKAESARIKADEDVGIQEQNKERQVEVAGKNRERVIAVETVRVERERQREEVEREREVEVLRIEKDKEIEQQKREIADVIRERVAVDKTVAEQEEAIKKVRVVEEAERTKQAMIITAEAEAQELLVKDIKAAEAAEKAAEHKGREQLVLADAKLKASDMHAKAQIRMAEGARAEHAAIGLAEAEVKVADADATEKHGLAEVRVKEADAVAVEKLGLAEASVLRQKGMAEGEAIREQLVGEAKGLTEKAEAMKVLDEQARDHEEYRLRLEAEKEIALKSVDVRREIAEAQATVLSEGLRNADIDIVGGDDVFFDRLINAVGMGKAIDGFVDKSESTQRLLGDYLSGESSFTEDLKEVLTRPAVASGDVRNLTLAAVLGKLMAGAEGERQTKLGQLMEVAERMDLDQVKVSDLLKS